MASEMRSPNVSVTPINVEPYPPASLTNGDVQSHQHVPSESVRLQNGPQSILLTNGETLDSSDAEVAQIDFQSSVSLRTKKNRVSMANEMPRPMSWEGELSDSERDMCVDEDSAIQLPENLSVSQSKHSQISPTDSKESPIMRLKQPPIGNYSLHSTPSNSPLLSQRHPVTGVPILSHKDLMHKDIIHTYENGRIIRA